MGRWAGCLNSSPETAASGDETAPAAPPAASRAAYDPASFWEGRLRTEFDLTGVGYRRIGKPFNKALYRQREIVLGRVIKRTGIDPRGVRIVELGPGTGFYVELWRRWGAAGLVGLDITEVATERLAATFPEFRFAFADITERWLVEDASAELVTAFDVLFHVVDDERFATALAEAARVLRPGGHPLVSDLFPHRHDIRAYHQVSRTLATYSAILERLGFDVVGRAPVFVTMHPAFDAPQFLRGPAARWWTWLEAHLIGDPLRGRRLGKVLGTIDRVLTWPFRGGPSTEILVARKR
jgi:SAM-dependent methyltransferase